MSVNTLDKYFTPDWLVEHTIKKAIEIIGKENITELVEPSAGDGAFIEALKKNFPDIVQRYYDLYPEHPEVVRQDYKKLILSYKKGRMTIGNPPFGTSSSLWKAFCKKAATNSDWIVFVSPASQYNSNYYFKEGELVYSELLNDVEYRGSEEHGGKATKVRTCLNIYKVYDREASEDWRYGQLQKDVIIEYASSVAENKYDFYIARKMSQAGKIMYEFKPFYGPFGVKILNEDKRNVIINVINRINEDLLNKSYTHLTGLNINVLKAYLIKHLYPTREERLEQDVKIHIILKSTSETYYKDNDFIRESDWKDYDYFISSNWPRGRMTETPIYSNSWGIKILNEVVRDKIKQFCENLEKECNDSKEDTKVLRLEYLKEQLIKHLYPTREERLEQDVLITRGMNKRDDWDLYVGRWGLKNAGRITDNLKQEPYCVKILNENRRKDIEEFFKSFRDKIDENEPMDQCGTGPTINGKTIKDSLMNYLYPQDDTQFEDYDYPEVRKPVKVERAHHAKPLLEPEYKEEPLPKPKEEKTYVIKSLF